MGEILNNVRAQVLVDALPYIQKFWWSSTAATP